MPERKNALPLAMFVQFNIYAQVAPLDRRGMKKFNEELDEKFVEEVRKHKNLYDISLSTYKDANIAENSWSSIAEVVDDEWNVCKDRWKYFRDTFIRKRKKEKSGDEATCGEKCLEAARSTTSQKAKIMDVLRQKHEEVHQRVDADMHSGSFFYQN